MAILGAQCVPGDKSRADDVVVACVEVMPQRALAQVEPDGLDEIGFRRIGQQRDERDIVRRGQMTGHVPTSLVENESRVVVRRELL